EMLGHTNKIYVKRTPVNRPPILFQVGDHLSAMPAAPRPRFGSTVGLPDFQKEAERIVLGRYGPPFVLVNNNFDVVLIRGKIDRYLRLPQGEPTVNILKMAPEGLFLELRNALNEARRSQTPVRRERVRLNDDHGTHFLAFEIMPVKPVN